MQPTALIAPPLSVARWFNTPQALTLEALRGRVVVLHAFQMLCPGCVSHGLPQATRMHDLFDRNDVAVIGLHTVFEHHAVMNAAALEVFIQEYRLAFPIGIDTASRDHAVPLTMRAFGLRGTPSVVLIDREGRIRLNSFGPVDDMALGALIGQALASTPRHSDERPAANPARAGTATCDDQGCAID